MAIDTPARIVVLGAGPIGLEAALYGRFLGYDVDIFDVGAVADNLRRWGHVHMFSPFSMNASSLGLAALQAQDESYRPPKDNALLTGHELREQYLLPLSQTDLLSDHLHLETLVISVGQQRTQNDPPEDKSQRGDAKFELLVENAQGQRRVTADVVIDATGTYRTPRCLGTKGVPAEGESELRESVDYHLPDIRGKDKTRFSSQRTLVVGSGDSAATTVVALAELAASAARTEIVWLTRPDTSSPMIPIENDTLPARHELTEAANRLAISKKGAVRHIGGSVVHRLETRGDGGFRVTISGKVSELIDVDRIVAQVGYRPDDRLQSEPPNEHYYVLGSKSYRQDSPFLIDSGLQQIRQTFSRLVDRHDLDLYANMRLP